MTLELVMELRSVQEPERSITGVVAPYDETTYLVPGGERIRKGAFARTIENHARATRKKIGLYRNHQHDYRLGVARRFTEAAEGLIGEFVVNAGRRGDEFLEECQHGYYAGMSVGMMPVRTAAGADGAREILEAALGEVSMVGFPAYEGAALLSVRSAQNLDELMAPFVNRPAVNLDPIPPLLYRPR
jgi:uncharacterized protein